MVDPHLPVGTPIEVRNHFERKWSSGFVVAAVRANGDSYRVQRRSDRVVLPELIGADDVRPDHAPPPPQSRVR